MSGTAPVIPPVHPRAHQVRLWWTALGVEVVLLVIEVLMIRSSQLFVWAIVALLLTVAATIVGVAFVALDHKRSDESLFAVRVATIIMGAISILAFVVAIGWQLFTGPSSDPPRTTPLPSFGVSQTTTSPATTTLPATTTEAPPTTTTPVTTTSRPATTTARPRTTTPRPVAPPPLQPPATTVPQPPPPRVTAPPVVAPPRPPEPVTIVDLPPPTGEPPLN